MSSAQEKNIPVRSRGSGLCGEPPRPRAAPWKAWQQCPHAPWQQCPHARPAQALDCMGGPQAPGLAAGGAPPPRPETKLEACQVTAAATQEEPQEFCIASTPRRQPPGSCHPRPSIPRPHPAPPARRPLRPPSRAPSAPLSRPTCVPTRPGRCPPQRCGVRVQRLGCALGRPSLLIPSPTPTPSSLLLPCPRRRARATRRRTRPRAGA